MEIFMLLVKNHMKKMDCAQKYSWVLQKHFQFGISQSPMWSENSTFEEGKHCIETGYCTQMNQKIKSNSEEEGGE